MHGLKNLHKIKIMNIYYYIALNDMVSKLELMNKLKDPERKIN
jgi:hypothetical protein